MNRLILYLKTKLVTLFTGNRLCLSFSLVFISIFTLEAFCSQFLTPQLLQWIPFAEQLANPALEISFIPELWLALIALTLGTLIIVISIAAQNIPKISELFMQDWVSLLYIWFLIIANTHAIYIQLCQDSGAVFIASRLLNLYIFLPLSILLALPYISMSCRVFSLIPSSIAFSRSIFIEFIASRANRPTT